MSVLFAVLAPAARATAASAPRVRADTSYVQLGEVLVRGARPIAAPGGAGAVRAKLDSLALRAVPTVEQVLRALPGTYLRTNSRGESEVTVRGSESRQAAVLLDGVPLTFAWDGRADVSVLPALAIEEVSLVRGLSSLTQAPNALGGVVELSTNASEPARQRSASLRAGLDELGGYGVAASVDDPRRLGRALFTMRAGAGHRDTPGFALPRGVRELLPTTRDRRLNTDLRETNGFLALRFESDSGPFVSLLGAGVRAERGIAAQLGVTAARFWRYPRIARGIGILSAGTGRQAVPWGGRAELQVSGGYDHGRNEIDAYSSRAYTTIASREDGDDEVVTLRAVASQSLGDRADARLAVSRGDIRHDEILNGVRNAYRQRIWSAAGQATARLPGAGVVRALDLSAGATLDGADTPLTGGKPSFQRLDQWGGRFGLAAHLGSSATIVHAGVSRRARFPSLRELYSGSLGSFEPNPGLAPERLRALEAGLTARDLRTSAQVVAFHHLLADAVVRIRPPGRNFQRVNQEGIRSAGVELLASHAFGVVELSGDLVVQDVRVLDPAAGLTRPENMPEVMGGIRAQVPLGAGVQVAVDARYTGGQFAIDPENDVESRLAPAGRIDVAFLRHWPFGGGAGWFRDLQLRAELENLTDAAQYDAFGLPRPGRTMRLEMRLH